MLFAGEHLPRPDGHPQLYRVPVVVPFILHDSVGSVHGQAGLLCGYLRYLRYLPKIFIASRLSTFLYSVISCTSQQHVVLDLNDHWQWNEDYHLCIASTDRRAPVLHVLVPTTS